MSVRLPLSLRARLLAGMAAIALMMIAVAAVVTSTIRSNLIAQLDDRLVAAASADPVAREPWHLRDELHESRETPEEEAAEHAAEAGTSGAERQGPERFSELYEGIVGVDGVLTTRFAPNLPGSTFVAPDLDIERGDLAPDEQRIRTVGEDDEDRYRVLERRIEDSVLVYGLPLRDVDDTLKRLIWLQTAGALGALAVLGAVTWWVTKLGIQPIKQITAAAADIAGGDLDARVPVTSPRTEAGQLALSLNSMLGRIEDAVDERSRSEARLRRFVADASHELRTPITTIRGYSELYRFGGLAEAEALDDAMRRTEQEAARMGRLVEDMLTLAKLDQHRPLDRQPVDLARVIADAALDAAVVAPNRSITVESAEDIVVIGDVDRIRQAVANVVGNALAHTPDGTPIALRLVRHSDTIVFEVVDQGPGMQPEEAERATERFWRADTSRSRSVGGSGLGLAIVDSIMAAHGGSTTVESIAGEGTTVRLTFQAAPDQITEP